MYVHCSHHEYHHHCYDSVWVQIIDDDEGEVSEEGLDKESIEMIISETKCSRQKAIKALKRNPGDVVNAILEINN